MIVISAGLQKAGTGLFFNLTNDMLAAAGNADIRELRETYKLDDILKHYNCNIEELSWQRLRKLLPLHTRGKRFVVKTHNRPTKWVKSLKALKVVKATFIYRDPRDVVLSALDHGRRIREEGLDHTFAVCTTVKNTIPRVKAWLNNSAMEWIDLEGVLLFKYEDLVRDPVSQMKRVADFLKLDRGKIDFEGILARYDRDKLDSDMKDYLHYNIGSAGRFRTELSEEDLVTCTREFSPYLEKMGYPQ